MLVLVQPQRIRTSASSWMWRIGVSVLCAALLLPHHVFGDTVVVNIHSQDQQQQCSGDSSLLPTTTTIEETPEDQLGPFYLPNSPKTMVIGPIKAIANPRRRLHVSGKVISTVSCEGLRGINVEVWFAGPRDKNGSYYQSNAYRGQMVTDANGYYNFTQTFPALYPTRPILHDHFRLSRQLRAASTSEELLVTQMYFYAESNNTSTATQQEKNGYVSRTSSSWGVDPLQVVSIARDTSGARTVQFNLYLDITNPTRPNIMKPSAPQPR